MRIIATLNLIILLLFLVAISVFAYLVITKIIGTQTKKRRRIILAIYSVYSFCILLTYSYLFFGRDITSTTINYALFFNFNVLLLGDIVVKIILSVSLTLYWIILVFRTKERWLFFAGSIFSLGVILSLLSGVIFGKNIITVKEIDLKFADLPEKFDGFKLVQLSDIHLGSLPSNSKLVEKSVTIINTLKPDAVLFTGDITNNFSWELRQFSDVVSKINSKYGNYSILGNHDYGHYSRWEDKLEEEKNFQQIVDFHQQAGFELLQNANYSIINGADTIYIMGVENWGHPPFPQYANLDSAYIGIPEDAFKILMTHDPAHWESQIQGKENIQLSLAGHTHGAQLGILIAGIEFSPIYLTRKLWAGIYGSNNQYLYVNRGLGTIGLNMRLDMPPEITVITLKRSKID